MTAPQPKLHIRSAAELVGALRDPQPMVRLGVLRHVAKHPDKALAYGRHEGQDVLDVLTEQVRGMQQSQLRHAALLTIANFRDPRAVAFLMEDLPRNEDPESVISMMVRLGEERTEPVRRLLVSLLDRDPLSAHARTAANVLAWWPDWEPDLPLRLRMSLLSDVGKPEPPPFDDLSADLWLAQLRGPLGTRAWEFLEMQGLPAFAAIGARWDELDDALRLALLQWGGRKHLGSVGGLLRQTLRSSDVDLLLEALGLLARLPQAQETHQERLRELWGDARIEVRRAVVRAGLRDLDWERVIGDEHDLALRRELLAAYARQCPTASLPLLARCLEADEWQVRATAAQLLIEAGEPAIEEARARTFHARPEVRLAACQALIGLGQQEWLEDTFL